MNRQFQTFNFSVRNASSDSVDVHIDGQIVDAQTQEIYKQWFGDETSVSFRSFRNQLNSTDAKTYNVYINSGGGLVTDAMAMHDLLVDMQAKGKTVNTYGRGIIASAATYILMAGKNAEMSKNSWFMIHNVSGFGFGDVNEMESIATTLRKFNNQVRDFYANATGQRKEEITKMMDAETWMTADEAKTKGFVKQVSGDSSFTNSIEKAHWQFSNMAVLNAYNSSVKPTPENLPPHQFFQNQFDDMKKFFTDIVNAIKGVKPADGADQAALVQQIANAVSAPFEKVGDEIETTIANQVTAGLTSKPVTDAIAAAVANAIKPFETRVQNLETANTDLVKKNGELETEIANNKGSKTGADDKGDKAPVVTGKWS